MLDLAPEDLAEYAAVKAELDARLAVGDVPKDDFRLPPCVRRGWGELSPEAEALAEAVFVRHDVKSVVSLKDAARAAGVKEGVAARLIDELKAQRQWPYRDPAPGPGGSAIARRPGAPANPREMLDALVRRFPLGHPITSAMASEATGVPRTSVVKYIQKLKAEGEWPFSPHSRGAAATASAIG